VFALFDDRGLAVDLAETFPTLESARSELDFLRDNGELDPPRTYRILWRPIPRDWQPLPDEANGR